MPQIIVIHTLCTLISVQQHFSKHIIYQISYAPPTTSCRH